MDIDIFVEYINVTQQSVARGIKHFDLTMRSAVMTKAIKEKGYVYNKQKQEWIMDKSHTASHDTNSQKFTSSEKKKVNVVTIGFDSEPKVQKNDIIHTSSHDTNSHEFIESESSSQNVNSHDFTQDEIGLIRAMLNEWKKGGISSSEIDLLNRIEAMPNLPKSEKVRKTIVISEDIGDRLDEFCEEKRVQKSHVLELAIEDFISKYQ